mmetsp:Transcript_4636/g.5035  ORF Transcript_4636/g.5035 Transcript_4636/m.5035 type:complete len:161 (+) Transcript_4636:40-522(+)
MSARVLRFCNLAVSIAEKSSMDFKHGAVCVKGNKIRAVGWNKPRTCVQSVTVPSLHAEIDCLKNKSVETIAGSELFIARVSSTGLGNSKPCRHCLETIKTFQIKRVVYSTRDGWVSELVRDIQAYDKEEYISHLQEINGTGTPSSKPVIQVAVPRFRYRQ